ncbi:MAG: GTP-binding protein [Bacteroidota bacterium]
MDIQQKPVSILTGFLGAGKTTFLNHLLNENKHIRYAIIENEFGEQGIDGELVIHPEGDDTIVEMNNGCLCCTLNDNLYEIINELYVRRDEFDELIIEATGVADPTGLAQPFLTHPLIQKHFPLKGVICLVDAELIETQLKNTEEAKNQVAFSDVLLINKTDRVDAAHIKELSQKLQQQNPLASIVQGNRESYPVIELNPEKSPLEELFHKEHHHEHHNHNYDHHEHHDHHDHKHHQEIETEFPVAKPHSHHHHSHTEEIVSHTFHFDQPFDYNILDRHLFVYLMLHAEGLYRMKGLVWLDGGEDQYLVQSVGTQLEIEEKRAWMPNEKRKSVMVFIGKNLVRKDIEELLNKCISKRDSIHP